MSSSVAEEVWTGREDRTALRLREWPWHVPAPDVVEVVFDRDWSAVRSADLGRPFWSYAVVNHSRHHTYQLEVFVGVGGDLCACCSCPASAPCKHIIAALADLWSSDPEHILLLAGTPFFDGFMGYMADLEALVVQFTNLTFAEIRNNQ